MTLQVPHHILPLASHSSPIPTKKNLLHRDISLKHVSYRIASLPKTELSMLSIVVLGFVILSYLSYKFFIYPAFLSPLAAIPNAHFTSSFSNRWIIWQRYRGKPNKAIHDAHTRLGPVVRLGLTEISVNSVEALNVIYSGNFEKDKFYIPFANYE
jgi:hypothetical protein